MEARVSLSVDTQDQWAQHVQSVDTTCSVKCLRDLEILDL